jgi:hypothetical protein
LYALHRLDQTDQLRFSLSHRYFFIAFPIRFFPKPLAAANYLGFLFYGGEHDYQSVSQNSVSHINAGYMGFFSIYQSMWSLGLLAFALG